MSRRQQTGRGWMHRRRDQKREGHTSSSEVNRYTRGANQRKLAEAAVKKLSNL